ncbi:EAL domain-containing protein [Terrarubrum flagellatum]|uniref:EAL domain-containing protein n=1 Tax=Terrirubrum flagellatum TaxID=2895980 RepID=UPI003144E101
MTQTITMRTAPFYLGGLAACAAAAGFGASYWLATPPPVSALLGMLAAGCGAAGLELRARRRQIDRLEDAVLRLASGLERAGAHLAALDDRSREVEQWITRDARPGVEQSAAEIEMLGTLVKELAVTVAHHDAELGAPTGAAPAAPIPAPLEPTAAESQKVANALDRAVAEGAFELHLQPIVSLPQRRVKFYEAFARLRAPDGGLIPHDHGLALADGAGRRAALDAAAIRRLAIATRRLVARNRDIATFLRVSDRCMSEPEALISALHSVQDLAGHLVIVFSQTTGRMLGRHGLARLKPLVDLGFTFGVDGVVDLRLDARMLFDHGVRYVKASADILLAGSTRAPSEIHPQDLARLLARNGIQLIVDGLDLERTVVEALDLDVRFGQGDAFSAPRPVKPELLEPIPDPPVAPPPAPPANDVPAAEPAAPPSRSSYRSTLRRA